VHHEEIIPWRQSSEVVVEHKELMTGICGTASAPLLTTRYLQQLAEEGEDKYPCKAKVLKCDCTSTVFSAFVTRWKTHFNITQK
jgi:hypothetical protein